jgi:hypothetical protein
MKILLIISALLIGAVSATADELRAAQASCSGNTCEFEVDLVQGRAVSYYIVSQTSGSPGLQISYQGNLIVDTKVHSVDLSNKSTGDFIAPGTGRYTVTITSVLDVREDTATITNSFGDTVSQTYQFAGEDAGDGDYNDIYGAITWFRHKG